MTQETMFTNLMNVSATYGSHQQTSLNSNILVFWVIYANDEKRLSLSKIIFKLLT